MPRAGSWIYVVSGFTILLTVSLLLSYYEPPSVQAASGGKAGTTLTVTKTADGQFISRTQWSIDKTVSPASTELFRGDSIAAQYQVSVTKSASQIYRVTGEICVTNGGAVATQNLVIVDKVQYKIGLGKYQDVQGASQTIIPSEQIAAGDTECYPYEIEFTPIPDAKYRNAVDVTITNHAGKVGTPFGPSYRTDLSFPSTPTSEGHDSINVSDTNGQSFFFSDSGTQTYAKTFSCDSDEGLNSNTATIDETGQSDSADIDVNCWALEVTKDVSSANIVRQWKWFLDKTAEVTDFGTNIHYEITLTGVPVLGYLATGNIHVHNPTPIAAEIDSLADNVPGAIFVTIDCGSASFPYTLAANADLDCTYEASLPNTDTRTNTAIANLRNHDYDSTGTPTAAGITSFSGTATIEFGATPSTVEMDECVTVQDINSFGQTIDIPEYCASGTATHTVFTEYDLELSGACNGVDISNTATFTTDSGATASASANVNNASGSGFGDCVPIRTPEPPPEQPWREPQPPPE